MEVVRNNLKGNDAIRDWEQNGSLALFEALARVEFPDTWNLTIRDCHHRPANGKQPVGVRLVVSDQSQARFAMKVSPPAGNHTFDVDLSPPNGKPTTKQWQELDDRLSNICPPPPKPVVPPPQPPPPPPEPTKNGPSTVERLVKMQSSFAKLIDYARDAETLEQMHQELKAKVTNLNRQLKPTEQELAKAQTRQEELRIEARTVHQLIANLKAKVAEAEAREVAIHRDLEDVEVVVARSRAAHNPLATQHSAALAQLKDVEKEIEDRKAQLGKAADVSVLLAALEKMG